MVRTYKRRYTNARIGKNHVPDVSYSKESLKNAIQAVTQGMSHAKTAAIYKFPNLQLVVKLETTIVSKNLHDIHFCFQVKKKMLLLNICISCRNGDLNVICMTFAF